MKQRKSKMSTTDRFGNEIRIGSTVKVFGNFPRYYVWRVIWIDSDDSVTVERKNTTQRQIDMSRLTCPNTVLGLFNKDTSGLFDEKTRSCVDRDSNKVWIGDDVVLVNNDGIEVINPDTLEDAVVRITDIGKKGAIVHCRTALAGNAEYPSRNIRKISKIRMAAE